MMSFDDFKRFVDSIADEPISEFNFSGGEPFANPDVVSMILYACEKLKCDISCASNLSLITDDQICRLANKPIKFNIQFPFANENKFHKSTGNGDYNRIVSTISKLREANIEVGLNTVIQQNNEDDVREVILFALNNELPLKLLPQIGGNCSAAYKDFVYPILRECSTAFLNKGTGATRWIIEDGRHRTTVLYIDSPCFYKDIDTCRKFGELRVLPDFSLQSCVLRSSSNKLDLSCNKEGIISQMNEVWSTFKTC